MTTGEKIKSTRLAINLSQSELSKLTGISERSIISIEQNAFYPRASNLRKIAAALHVTVAYLMDESASDTQKDSDRERFIAVARSKYGAKGAREVENLLERTSALFAGGELDDESKDLFFQSIEEVYFESKRLASAKFSPKKRKSLKQEGKADNSKKAAHTGVDA